MISDSTGQRQEVELVLSGPIALEIVKAFDRYSYVNNNPVRYTDPSRHLPAGEFDDDVCLPILLVMKIGAFRCFMLSLMEKDGNSERKALSVKKQIM